MLFWALFFIAVCLLTAQYKLGGTRRPAYFVYIGIIFIIFIAIFRFDVGFDYPAYYHSVYPRLALQKLDRIEPLSTQLFYIADYFKYPPLVFILFGLITYGFAFYALKKYTDDFFLATLVFITFFFMTTMGVIRQGAAMGVILFSYKYIKDFCLWKYALCVMLAWSLHASAAVAICIPIIYRYFNFKLLIICVAGLFALFKCGMSLVEDNLLGYENYLKHMDDMEGGKFTRIVYVAINVIMFYLARHSKKEVYPLLYISSLGCAFPFIFGGHLGGRIANYFLIFLCISIPNTLRVYVRPVRRVAASVLFLYFIAIVFISSRNKEKSPYTPYQTIFTVDLEHPVFKK